VRTDPDAPKHAGITFLIFDLKSPGISVSPLIDMTWSHYFNETFFEDVRVPIAGSVVGEENRGWYVSMTLLDFERSNIAGAVQERRTVSKLVEEWKTGDQRAIMRLDRDPTLRTEIAERYIESEVQFQFAFRIVSMQNAGVVPNYEASTGKLYYSELTQRVSQTGVKTFGLYGNLWDEERPGAPMYSSFARSYLRSSPATVRGGTSEIQRNIIATRGLGLPMG
jgi:alkylation response protein AidB-like acyl-CoA dehydrogenase